MPHDRTSTTPKVVFPINILLIEDNPFDTQHIEELLAELGQANYEVVCVETLADGMALVGRGRFSLVLLDLQLPDSPMDQTAMTFMQGCAEHVAVVIMSSLGDEETAATSLGYGIQDYLVKGNFDAFVLGRVIRYAIERQRLQYELREKQAQELAALKALVPFCAYCGKVRDRATNKWCSPSDYLERYAEIDATHGICPDCRDRQLADMVEQNEKLAPAVRRLQASIFRSQRK